MNFFNLFYIFKENMTKLFIINIKKKLSQMDKKIFKITIWVTLRLSLMLLSMLLHLLLQNKKTIEKPLIIQLNIG